MTKSAMLEADWMRQVVQVAELYGWSYVHFRPAQTTRGWRTPVQGPLGKGWPDMLLVHRRLHRTIAVELKRDGLDLADAQVEVLATLEAGGIETYVWTPADFDTVVRVLSGR